MALWYTVDDECLGDILPESTASNATCDYLGKYLLSKGPKGDANIRMVENYLSINFKSDLLNDKVCLDALLSDTSSNILAKNYHSKIEMRFLYQQGENVLITSLQALGGQEVRAWAEC
jgi:hypothetical protein